MLYNFFDTLTMAVLYFTVALYVGAFIHLVIMCFQDTNLKTKLFGIFLVVLTLSLGFQCYVSMSEQDKGQGVEQHNTNN